MENPYDRNSEKNTGYLKVDTNKIFKQTNLNWLERGTIFLTVHGSHAYGLNHEGSDIDIRGIAIPPTKYYFGILDSFEQAQFSEPYDCVIFDLRKFVKLALECNPNVIELLFIDPKYHIIKTSIFDQLIKIRDAFISKKAKYTFAGYARSQLLRLQRHRRWLLNQDKYEKKPERIDFGLPDTYKLIPTHKLQEIEAQITKKINQWNFDSTGLDRDVAINIKNEVHDILFDLKINQDDFHTYAARSIGLDDNLIEAFKKERRYISALKEYKAYQIWKKERNRERYAMEQKYGFDLKHCSHLVRLYIQAVHLLKTKEVLINVSDLEEIAAVRRGDWKYEQLVEWAGKQDKILDELYKTSDLKREPDRNLVNKTLIELLTTNVLTDVH